MLRSSKKAIEITVEVLGSYRKSVRPFVWNAKAARHQQQLTANKASPWTYRSQSIGVQMSKCLGSGLVPVCVEHGAGRTSNQLSDYTMSRASVDTVVEDPNLGWSKHAISIIHVIFHVLK